MNILVVFIKKFYTLLLFFLVFSGMLIASLEEKLVFSYEDIPQDKKNNYNYLKETTIYEVNEDHPKVVKYKNMQEALKDALIPSNYCDEELQKQLKDYYCLFFTQYIGRHELTPDEEKQWNSLFEKIYYCDGTSCRERIISYKDDKYSKKGAYIQQRH